MIAIGSDGASSASDAVGWLNEEVMKPEFWVGWRQAGQALGGGAGAEELKQQGEWHGLFALPAAQLPTAQKAGPS